MTYIAFQNIRTKRLMTGRFMTDSGKVWHRMDEDNPPILFPEWEIEAFGKTLMGPKQWNINFATYRPVRVEVNIVERAGKGISETLGQGETWLFPELEGGKE